MAPILTRHEKLIMRMSDRKDVFTEKFEELRAASDDASSRRTLVNHHNGSRFSVQDKTRTRADSSTSQTSASDTSFSLGGSAVWVGDESSIETAHINHVPQRGRSSTNASSGASSILSGRKAETATISGAQFEPMPRTGPKDTHVFPTSIVYKGHTLPVRVPLATFPEEVGDVCGFDLFLLPRTNILQVFPNSVDSNVLVPWE